MANRKSGYKLSVTGPGHNFEREIDETVASQIISLAMIGKASSFTTGSGAGIPKDGTVSIPNTPGSPQPQGSLASHIKAKKGDKNQNNRFLATAHWLSGRSDGHLTAKAVAESLAHHNQKRLANPADCLNQNVRKGYCEKRKDGSFFITPEGLEALEGAPAE